MATKEVSHFSSVILSFLFVKWGWMDKTLLIPFSTKKWPHIREIHRCIYSLKLRAKNVFPGFVAIIFGIQFVHHYSSLPSSWPYRKHFLMILQNWLISFLNRSKYIFFSNCISRIYQVYRCISHLSRFFLPV